MNQTPESPNPGRDHPFQVRIDREAELLLRKGAKENDRSLPREASHALKQHYRKKGKS